MMRQAFGRKIVRETIERNLLWRALSLLFRDPRAFLHGSYRQLYRLLTDLQGDLRLGVWTGLWKPKYHDDACEFYGYEPVSYSTLRDLRRHMRARNIAVKTFIDVGCGFARPLYFFAVEFEELLGYEITDKIYRASVEQLARARVKNPDFRKISLLMQDATLSLPLDRNLVLFLYNPFGPDPMARLCDRLKESEHETHIYYVNPQYANLLEEHLGVRGEQFSTFMKVCYFHVPARAAAV